MAETSFVEPNFTTLEAVKQGNKHRGGENWKKTTVIANNFNVYSKTKWVNILRPKIDSLDSTPTPVQAFWL